MRAFEDALSEDQEALRASISGFLAGTQRENGAAHAEGDYGWRRLSTELELTGLALPESMDGAGATWFEVCMALEAMGYVSYAGPYLSTVGLAQSLLLAVDAGTERDELLRRLGAGRRRAAVALTPGFGPVPSSLVARETDGGWIVSGSTGPVLDAATSDLVLAALPVGGDDVGVFAFDPHGERVTLTALEPFDLGRPIAALALEDVHCRRLGDVPAGGLELAMARARVALACEQVGGMQACLETAVEYAGQRKQFGRAIGSFQAIKHRCADMLVLVESARALAYEAVEAVVAEVPEHPLVVSAAKVFCSDAYLQCAGDCIQIHGSVGFTWEQGVHLFYRRAIAGRALLGSPHEHREQLAAALLGEHVSTAGR